MLHGCYMVPSAARTHKFVRLFFFSYETWNKLVFSHLCPPLPGKHLYTFSHAWCHDISWSVPLEDSNPFIDTGWIYPSQYPPSWLYFHPAGFGWQLSQERTRCSRNMSDSISCDHSQSGVVGGLVPTRATRATPRSLNLKHGCNFFHWGKNDSGLPKCNKVEQTYGTNEQNHQKPIENTFLSHFERQF